MQCIFYKKKKKASQTKHIWQMTLALKFMSLLPLDYKRNGKERENYDLLSICQGPVGILNTLKIFSYSKLS